MAKSKTQYVCQTCGNISSKWVGKCDDCGSWNSFVQEEIQSAAGPKAVLKKGNVLEITTLQGEAEKPVDRFVTKNGEFDRVLGGGIVPGSVVLIGGDPGIGKSTLLLQIAADMSRDQGVLYVSGEEGIDQIRMRAKRLNVHTLSVDLSSSTSVANIIATLDQPQKYGVAIVDSIQTMVHDRVESSPGTVTQVRACAQELVHIAKKRGIAIFIVGHVTKEGTLAGPRVLEHLVDTVLYFEGDKGHQYRLLRTVKNRFGPTDEIGVFEMVEKGLMPVANPSALFLTEREAEMSGTAVFAGVEGTRPLLVEVQALLAPCTYGAPRRLAVGYDVGRLSMIIAILESRGGLKMGQKDVYLNVAGGMRITEPASDIAVAAALISAYFDVPFQKGAVFFGELSLASEVRSVSQMEARLKEAKKLGFTSAYTPKSKRKVSSDLSLETLQNIGDLIYKCYQLKKKIKGEKKDDDYTRHSA